jgi:hypothetical protein
VQTWRLVTLILVALTMGLSFAHALEMPAKLEYDAALYVTVQQTLYRWWGPPLLGILMVVLVAVFFRLTLTPRLVDMARRQAEQGLVGRMEGHAGMDMSVEGRAPAASTLQRSRGLPRRATIS